MTRNQTVKMALVLLLSLAAGYAPAIPQDSFDPDRATNSIDTLPADADLVYTPAIAPTSSPDTTLTSRQSSDTNASALWSQPSPESFRVIGRYSERFNNMDVDHLVFGIVTNDALLREQSSRLRLDPDTLQRDLEPMTNADSSAELMRQIQESIEAEQSQSSDEEIKGLRLAITYLLLAAAIIVVIFARR